MNPAQRTILICALVAALGMIVFPPWIFVFDPPARTRLVKAERPAGYHLLFGNHIPEDSTELGRLFGQFYGFEYFSVRLDGARLLMQLVGLGILTVIASLVLSKARSPNP